jgi:Carboxypeptidase regulatory-like domain/TonB dependent receptor
MSIFRIGAALLVSVFLVATPVFSQSSNGTISGTVADASGAVVPGVTVTATNNATGVVTTVVSNDAGVYNFASLLPGTYKISATIPGFQTQTFTDVQLGNAGQLRLNVTLQVAAAAQAVEVSVEAENLITASSSSVGNVLPQKQIQDLPLVSNNVLDLVGTMGGTFLTNDKVFGAENTNFAGVSARDINIQRDGISVNNQRWPNGLETPTKMNPDLVGEIRMVLAPVDAEMGRGNGQIQILTRSGTNQFHGSAVWNVQNSFLDANTWLNNTRTPRITPAWRNMHEYDTAVGGPIKKNKTFFYVLWNQMLVESKSEVFPTVLTDCARRGIFRYFDGYINGNARQPTTLSGNFPQTATVNVDGSPKSPDGSPLRYLSVFGALASNPTKPDCSDAQIDTSSLVPIGAPSSFDPNRKQLDKTGFIAAQLATMPHANSFDNPGNLVAGPGVFVPDGLNTATLRWVRTNHGADNLFGAGGDTNNNRRQINFKIDHNFGDRHKVNASYSYEIDKSDDAALPTWPNGYFGADIRHPQVLGVNFTSTLTSSLVNEGRFGLSRTGANTVGAPERDDIGAQVSSKLLQVNGGPVYTQINTGSLGMANYGIADGILYASHEVSPRWVYADTVSWTKGLHSFRFGGEYRLSSTKSTLQGSVQTGPNRPRALVGSAALAQVAGINTAAPTLAGTAVSGSRQLAESLLNFLSGSLSTLSQTRFINSPTATWNDYPNQMQKIRDIAQNEFGFFFKDDWKATRDLTLNLGVRWDYYGVPYERDGLTTALQGGGYALFGLSGRSFSDWMQPGVRGDLMQITYVGPKSPNPGGQIYKRDLNNVGPAVGFAWNVPWGGKDKTTLRGGYQIQYLGSGRGFVLDTALGNPPGSSNQAIYQIPATDPYFSLEKLVANPGLVPVQPQFLPNPNSTIIPLTDRSALINAFDPNFVSPYIQNLTLSLTRNLTSKLTLDLRYIGTLSRKLPSNMDLNAPDFLYNGLKQAFDAARSGGDSPLLDQMFAGLNIANPNNSSAINCLTATGPTPCAPVGTVNSAGVLQTGAMHLRALTASCGLGCTFNTALANGNYVGLATGLNTLTNAVAGNSPGSVLRYNKNPDGTPIFPENFIRANPQVANSVMETNLGHSNYHSMQAQISLRPSAGVSTQLTYTWSRNLGAAPGEGANGTGATFTDPTNRAADYTLLSTHREHVVVNYGTFALPIGPQKLLFGKSSGIAARLIENWQASWIVNMSSGAPINIVANNMLYGLGVPDIVGPFDTKDLFRWNNGAANGNLFTDSNGQNLYTRVKDPQCSNSNIVAPSLQSLCTLNAIRNSAGQVVLQTPLPGTRGTLGQNRIEGLGTWSADMAVEKRVQIKESKSFTVRVDARNVFNHATPAISGSFFAPTGGAPDLGLQSAVPFATFNNKIGTRTFQLKARVDF